jgi:hypothetical protein
VTCRRLIAVTGAPVRSAPQSVQHLGSQTMTSSGSSTSGIVVPGAPSCLPGLRPDELRDERRAALRYGGSDDGGLLEVDESLLNRRSNSAIRAVSACICTACPAMTSRSPAFAARSSVTSADSSATSADSDGPDTRP